MAEITRSDRDVTIEEYLEFEKTSPVKHEFVGGRLYAMTGTTKRHNQIAFNIARRLFSTAEGTSCQVFFSDVKICPSGDRCYYPDVMVSCEPGSDDDYVEQTPCLIVEVTSSSTAATDRREKRMAYLQIPSLCTYLIVDQENRRVEHHIRLESGSWVEQVHIGEGELYVPCPSAHLTLADIYAGVPQPQ
jgi:Uma2 family endonuclease